MENFTFESNVRAVCWNREETQIYVVTEKDLQKRDFPSMTEVESIKGDFMTVRFVQVNDQENLILWFDAKGLFISSLDSLFKRGSSIASDQNREFKLEGEIRSAVFLKNSSVLYSYLEDFQIVLRKLDYNPRGTPLFNISEQTLQLKNPNVVDSKFTLKQQRVEIDIHSPHVLEILKQDSFTCSGEKPLGGCKGKNVPKTEL